MRIKKYLQLIVALIFISTTNFAQNRTITGKVSGLNGPIEGATISVEKSKAQTTSDENGFYSIEITLDDVLLDISAEKMSKTVKASKNAELIDILLIPSEKKLYKEVVANEQMRICDIYIDNYPQSEKITVVKAIKEKLFFIEAYNIAASQFSDTALRNYLKLYPEGNYKQKAIDAIEIALWQKARYENTAESYRNYINEYPKGKATQMAKDKIAELK